MVNNRNGIKRTQQGYVLMILTLCNPYIVQPLHCATPTLCNPYIVQPLHCEAHMLECYRCLHPPAIMPPQELHIRTTRQQFSLLC